MDHGRGTVAPFSIKGGYLRDLYARVASARCPNGAECPLLPLQPVRFRRERIGIIQRSLRPALSRKGLHPRVESVRIRTASHCRSVDAVRGLDWDMPIN
jgi:hypothetical protein